MIYWNHMRIRLWYDGQILCHHYLKLGIVFVLKYISLLIERQCNYIEMKKKIIPILDDVLKEHCIAMSRSIMLDIQVGAKNQFFGH